MVVNVWGVSERISILPIKVKILGTFYFQLGHCIKFYRSSPVLAYYSTKYYEPPYCVVQYQAR